MPAMQVSRAIGGKDGNTPAGNRPLQGIEAMAAERDRQQERESRRILKSVSGETDPSGTSLAGRTAKRVGAHLSAADADPEDRIETWGTRIGRVLGMAIMIGLAVWLFRLVFSNG
ncbi:hypothetical protein DES43_14011 [Aquamicrobium defluvii]|uniref:Uncharacterized protein n=2 Tax=Aquamicrobium defluvii TaxID=69279 RepID=A0A4R6Y5X9_9HYPH|nr:hypothetical protein DES43_14011 [Aquamicrobium defluvii]